MTTWEDASPRGHSGAAWALTTLAEVPRGLWYMRLIFMLRRVLGPPADLAGLEFIYYARTAILRDPGDVSYVYFESDFNGSFDIYIDAFSYVVPQHMTKIWSRARKFPGPKPATTFKEYIRSHDIPAAHYFARYGQATVAEVVRALEFRERFDRLVRESGRLKDDAFADRWHGLWAPPGSPSRPRWNLPKRDPNRARGGRTYGLTVLSRVRPGRLDGLRAELEALDPSPFAGVPETHFARLVVLDRTRFDAPEQLLFSCVLDGDRDAYMRSLCALVPDLVDRVWAHCCDSPSSDEPEAFAWWMRARQVRTTTFFAPYGQAGAEQVLGALELTREAHELALETRYATPRELRKAFRARFT